MFGFLNYFAASCQPKGISWLPTWYKYLDTVRTLDGKCDVNFDVQKDIGRILLAVFEIILRVGALIAVGYVIYGGVQYILSQGEPDRIKNARTTILNALIGLVIATLATVIVNFVGSRLI
jgi:hypothetical protein